MTMSALKCDVCGREGVIGVASSSIGPMSQAYCGECAIKQAEPEWMFVYLLEDVGGGKSENLAGWVNQLSTWKDGKYLTWEEWLATQKATTT